MHNFCTAERRGRVYGDRRRDRRDAATTTVVGADAAAVESRHAGDGL